MIAAGNAARVLRDERPIAPASRLALDSWIDSGRELHASGALTNEEYDALRVFFERVHHVNLSLQEASAGYHEIHTNRAAGPLLFRPWEKARKLIESEDNSVTPYERALAAVAAAITRLSR